MKKDKRLSNIAFWLLIAMPSQDMFKIFKNKKGMSDKNPMGDNLMATVGNLNQIVALISGLMQLAGGCGGEEGSDSDSQAATPEPPQLPTCSEKGGIQCADCDSAGGTFNYADYQPGVFCCVNGCAKDTITNLSSLVGVGNLNYGERGDSNVPCAENGVKCESKEFCPGEMWIASSDQDRCCQTVCAERLLSDEIGFTGIAGDRIAIEIRGDSDNYIVWYGPKDAMAMDIDEKVGYPVVGLPYYSLCTGSPCSFLAKDSSGAEKEFSIEIELENNKPKLKE